MKRSKHGSAPIMAKFRLLPAFMLLAGSTVSWAGDIPQQPDESQFREHKIANTIGVATSIFSIDLDADGDIDVLAAINGPTNIAWYENDGATPPSFTEHGISTDADFPFSVFAADMDGDGNIDVLSASLDDDKIAWYENSGGSPPTFIEHPISTNTDQAWAVFAIDLNGDELVDVLATSLNKIAWYQNNGDFPLTFTERVISTNKGLGLPPIFAADIDNDGDLDILTSLVESNNVVFYRNEGGTLPDFTEVIISDIGASALYPADMDQDGDLDILTASFVNDRFAWLENDGKPEPIFTEHVISNPNDSANSIVASDFDYDGDQDIVVSSIASDSTLHWYENDGASPPNFTEHDIMGLGQRAFSIGTARLDGDGFNDFATASFGFIYWYENLSPRLPGDLDDDGDVDLDDFALFQTVFTGPQK